MVASLHYPVLRRRHVLSCALMLACGAGVVRAADIRLMVVDGSLCVRGALQVQGKSIPAVFVIDLGMPAPVLVHRNTAQLMRLESQSTADVRLDGLVLEGLRAVSLDLPRLDELSNEYSEELGQVPAVAVLGMPAFGDRVLLLDLAERRLQLSAPEELVQQRQAGEAPTGRDADAYVTAELPFASTSQGYWLDGLIPEDFKVRVRFATTRADTVVDSITADLAETDPDVVFPLRLGPVDVARFVALRPEELTGEGEARADVILGTHLLEHFRVQIDTTRSRMIFQQVRSPSFPQEERAYFQARSAGDAEGIEAFLVDHAESRLAREAGYTLLRLRLDDAAADRESIKRALSLLVDRLPVDRRARFCLGLSDELTAGSREDRLSLAEDVLRVGSAWAPADRDGVASHQINARLGHLLLLRDEPDQARRLLLSAAFGLPRDPLVNLWLGQFYERTGRLTRAWSRYAQSALDKAPPVEALIALDRLHRDPAFRRVFSMAEAARMLEGRVPEFHPASRADEQGEAAAPRVSLVELFVCIEDAGSLAAELAFAGLAEYLEAGEVAFIQYHVPWPEPDPLTSSVSLDRATTRGVTAAPQICFAGERLATGAGDEQNVASLFGTYAARTPAVVAADPDERWQIEGSVDVQADVIAGQVRVIGPQRADELRLHLVLCESPVVVPGANGTMLHHNVARASLSGSAGLAIPDGAEQRSFPFRITIGEVGEQLKQTLARLEGDRQIEFVIRPTFVDAAACSVVAFIEHAETGRVLAARRLVIGPAGGMAE